jgi:hypothetical protein
LNLVGGLGFDGGGIMTPFIANAASSKDAEAWALFAGIAAAGNLTYGALSAAAGVLAMLNS